VTAIDILTPFADFEDYWRPFLGGQGPAPAYAMALDETARARLRARIRARIPLQADGSICLTARAWAVRTTIASSARAFRSVGQESPCAPDVSTPNWNPAE